MKSLISFILALTIFSNQALAAVTVNVNGTTHTIPQTNEKGWGANVTAWIQSISANTLQPNGGQFLLTNEIDFGPNFGLKTPYLKSRALNPATAGFFRLGNAEGIGWRNATNTGNYLLTVNAGTGLLEFDGSPLINTTTVAPLLALKADQTALDAHTTNVTNPHAVTKAQVGLPLVDNTSDATKNSATATLTNKTIDADSNSLSNISNASIKASAGISYSKLNLTNSVTNADLAGSIADSKLSTITTSGKVANSATTATATNTASTIVARDSAGSTALGGFDLAEQASSPTAPSAGFKRIYAKSDGKWYSKSSAGVEAVVGAGGGSGSKNYIADGDGEAGTNGWTRYYNAGYTPTTGTGAPLSTTDFTFTTSTTTPLRGASSFLISKTATSQRGEGVAFDFAIDDADKASILEIKLDHRVLSGTYTNGQVRVYLLDVTNNALVSEVSTDVPISSLRSTLALRFQTAANAKNYRLMFHCADLSATAYQLQVDSVSVGPQVTTSGAFISDWVSYTPSLPGFGTVTNLNAQWRRNVSQLEIDISFNAGTTTATIAQIGFPSGLVSASNVVGGGDRGRGYRGSANPANEFVMLGNPNATAVNIGLLSASTQSNVSQNGNAIVNTGEFFSARIAIPIAGWGSAQVLSSDAGDGRAVSVAGNKATGAQNATPTPTTILWSAVPTDTHAAYNAATGEIKIVVPGDYDFTAAMRFGPSASGNFAYINATVSGTQSYSKTLVAHRATVANQIQEATGANTLFGLKSGDVVTLRAGSDASVAIYLDGFTSFTMARRSTGNQQIAASESVSATYYNSSGQTIPNNAATTLTNYTKYFDSHSAMNAATGIYTIPAPGKYQINARIIIANAALPAGAYADLTVGYTGSVTGTQALARSDELPAAYTKFTSMWGTLTRQFNAGDTVYLSLSQVTGASRTLFPGTNENHFDIVRIGN